MRGVQLVSYPGRGAIDSLRQARLVVRELIAQLPGEGFDAVRTLPRLPWDPETLAGLLTCSACDDGFDLIAPLPDLEGARAFLLEHRSCTLPEPLPC